MKKHLTLDNSDCHGNILNLQKKFDLSRFHFPKDNYSNYYSFEIFFYFNPLPILQCIARDSNAISSIPET